MPNILKLTVETPDDILNPGAYGAGAIIRVQSGAAAAGPFSDLTGTGSTPTVAVVAGTRAYTAYDPNGTESTWYQTQFENVGATRVSGYGDPFQAGGEEGGLLCGLADVKQDLGITSTASDEDLLDYIRAVTDGIQHLCGRRFVRSPLSGTTTYLFDIQRMTTRLWVPQGIAECSQVEVATYTGAAFDIVPTTDWYLDPPQPERDIGWPALYVALSDRPTGSVSWFWPGKRVVRLTMAMGFETIPLNVSAIARRTTVAAFMSKGSGGTLVASLGPTSAPTVLRHLSPADRSELLAYQVPRR